VNDSYAASVAGSIGSTIEGSSRVRVLTEPASVTSRRQNGRYAVMDAGNGINMDSLEKGLLLTPPTQKLIVAIKFPKCAIW
jgi:hypothetical protein